MSNFCVNFRSFLLNIRMETSHQGFRTVSVIIFGIASFLAMFITLLFIKVCATSFAKAP